MTRRITVADLKMLKHSIPLLKHTARYISSSATAHIIDGKKMAADLKNLLKSEVKVWAESIFSRLVHILIGKPLIYKRPCLGYVMVGNDPRTHVYVNHKKKACEEVGFEHIGNFKKNFIVKIRMLFT